ncbi:MAG: hypothetical protein ABWK00_06815 [Desulfurococcaceae archaeon]
MLVRGVDFGLSFLFSYSTPLYDFEEIPRGFSFTKALGACAGLICRYDRNSLEAICDVPRGCTDPQKILGLDRSPAFRDLCAALGADKCPSQHITIIGHEGDRLPIFVAAFLSRSTDYFTNVVRWAREFIRGGRPEKYGSFQVRQLIDAFPAIYGILSSRRHDALEEAGELLALRNVGHKVVAAYLLHAYGMTEYAPLDRHYLEFLPELRGKLRPPEKAQCRLSGLRCSSCPRRRSCLHGVLVERLGRFNGVLQSLAYVAGRLSRSSRGLAALLTADREWLADRLEALIERSISIFFSGTQPDQLA